MKKTIALCFLLTLFALPLGAQEGKADPPPGSIKLLPGYQHKTGRGIDTAVGTIWKDGGITINYDIGIFAGMVASPHEKDRYLWYKEQTIGNQAVRIALGKARDLRVTFVEARASFLSLVPKEEDLTDALLMILTYKSR
jgi:hypothetical protein